MLNTLSANIPNEFNNKTFLANPIINLLNPFLNFFIVCSLMYIKLFHPTKYYCYIFYTYMIFNYKFDFFNRLYQKSSP